ncbi:DUF6122 family protein [Sinomicrobium weinanense]|uniref:Uncharacterized protein n=1 Tax=Sinomicrobium weinanense TaxID=2842200 RepID=A0A926Q3R4_9FLAO|nr:DUF6122 family protein [Sinomicrobium weinanense]MBC9796060.1 hypothetical protein [Sinomicrobium weinanense]MBU3123121.1 hypothetical protein [Sinomicrobium weinanense]
MLRFIVHYGLHFIFPVLIAYWFYRPQFIKVSLILLSGILIDIDHLLADTIFDVNRCSIGFHLLHGYIPIVLYVLLFTYKPTRIIGLALLLHILADTADCLLMSFNW